MYTEEEIMDSFQRLGDEGETLELDLDKGMRVFWFGANSLAQEMASASSPRPEKES